MTVAQSVWFAGLFIVSITMNTSLLKIITDDKFQRPTTVALFINLLLSLIGGFFASIIAGWAYSLGIILFNSACFFIIVYIVKKRDVTAVGFAEKLLVALNTIDLQISYILSEINERRGGDLSKAIQRALQYIISEIPNVIGLDQSHHPEISLLIPQNNKFKVIAYSGVENYRVVKMEEFFQYGEKTFSLAGHAMNQRKPVIVNSLAEDTNQELWLRTTTSDSKKGSILVFPIIRGLESENVNPIAILSIASIKENGFRNAEALMGVLAYFSQKIEILLSCLDLINVTNRDHTKKLSEKTK